MGMGGAVLRGVRKADIDDKIKRFCREERALCPGVKSRCRLCSACTCAVQGNVDESVSLVSGGQKKLRKSPKKYRGKTVSKEILMKPIGVSP